MRFLGPDSPDRAVVSRDFRNDLVIIASASLLFVCIGLGLVVMIVRHGRRTMLEAANPKI